MLRIMITKEENGVCELYTAGGSDADAFAVDIARIMKAPDLVSYHTTESKKLLLELAHKLETESGGLS